MDSICSGPCVQTLFEDVSDVSDVVLGFGKKETEFWEGEMRTLTQKLETKAANSCKAKNRGDDCNHKKGERPS